MEFKRREEIFNVFASGMEKLSMYESVLQLIKKWETDVRAEENVAFYKVFCDLMTSINNAGCEDRRSQQIDLLHKITREIVEKYEDYLP